MEHKELQTLIKQLVSKYEKEKRKKNHDYNRINDERIKNQLTGSILTLSDIVEDLRDLFYQIDN